jgi:hypothetical protein
MKAVCAYALSVPLMALIACGSTAAEPKGGGATAAPSAPKGVTKSGPGPAAATRGGAPQGGAQPSARAPATVGAGGAPAQAPSNPTRSPAQNVGKPSQGPQQGSQPKIPERAAAPPPSTLPPEPKGFDRFKGPSPQEMIRPEDTKPRPAGPAFERAREPIVPSKQPGLDPFENPARDLPLPSEPGYPRSPNMAPPGTPGSSVMPGPGTK